MMDIVKRTVKPPYTSEDIAAIGIFASLTLFFIFFGIIFYFQEFFAFSQVNQETQRERVEVEFVSNEILVKINPSSHKSVRKNPKPEDTGISSLNKLNRDLGVTSFQRIAKLSKKSKDPNHDIFRWYKITLSEERKILKEPANKDSNKPQFEAFLKSQKIKSTVAIYNVDPNVEVAELNYVVRHFQTLPQATSAATTSSTSTETASPTQVTALGTIPNDPYYSSKGSWGQSYDDLWGLKKINAAGAWDKTTGSTSIVVAVIDSGVDRNHEDLKDNMWVNTAEIPNNGIDDDDNGYKDDYYGWDFANNDNDPNDDYYHGTHVSGTIAAVGNNSKGVVGVNWRGSIMALKFLSSNGYGYTSDAITALQYAADMEAKISSNSWGDSTSSVAADDAINYEHDQGMVIVTAAGNSNADALDHFPAGYDRAITVAASDPNDAKASFSNWGEKIDVSAPGVGILSTKAAGTSAICDGSRTDVYVVGTNYCVVYGTSMAAPHVSGLAALLFSKNPNLTNEEIRQIIRRGADDLGVQGKDKDFGYGRINAASSMSIVDTKPLAPIITSPKSQTKVGGTGLQILGSVPGANFSSYKIEAGTGRSPTTWTTVTTSTSQVINGVLATVDTTRLTEGPNIFRLTATDQSGKTYQFQIHDVEVDNFDVKIIAPNVLVSQGNVDALGSADVKNGLVLANYKLEWGVGTSPTSWSTSGIALVNGGLQPVINGKLATWNTSSLILDQTYTLRLTVNTTIGVSVQSQVTVKVDKDLVPGWPKAIGKSGNCHVCQASVTFADLDGDGKKEVIAAGPDAKIYVFRKDGSNFPGFPVSTTVGDFFPWPINVDDLDNDGKKEIIASAFQTSLKSKTYIVRNDGTFYPGWSAPIHTIRPMGDGTPVVGDLNGDGKKELVVIDPYLKKIHAYQLNGTEITDFPRTLSLATSDYSYTGTPSIIDLDKDGKPEIPYGNKNVFYLFDNNGNILPNWPFIVPGEAVDFHSPAAAGDIDGDGELELVAIGDNAIVGCGPPSIYGWKKNGSLLTNWPMTTSSGSTCDNWPFHSPSVSDVDFDGKDEVVAGLGYPTVFDLEGPKNLSEQLSSITTPAISDVDGDGKLELSGSRLEVLGIVNDDGTLYWQRTTRRDTSFLVPGVFADLDNNGKMEFGVAEDQTFWSGDPIIYLWEIPLSGSNPVNYEWPMFGRDSARSGRLVLSYDSDSDGFADYIENYVGTDYIKKCPKTSTANDEAVDPWPPDFNDNGIVQIDDIYFVSNRFNAKAGEANYTKRAEIASQNGVIGIDDVYAVSNRFNQSCIP